MNNKEYSQEREELPKYENGTNGNAIIRLDIPVAYEPSGFIWYSTTVMPILNHKERR